MSAPNSPKSPKSPNPQKETSPIKCCFKSKPDPEIPLENGPRETIQMQPVATPPREVPPSPTNSIVVSPIIEEQKKGRKRTSNAASAAGDTVDPDSVVASVESPTATPTPPVTRRDSSASSNPSSASVITAVEVTHGRRDGMPGLAREHPPMETGILGTKSPEEVRKVKEESEESSPEEVRKVVEKAEESSHESKETDGMADNLPEEAKVVKKEVDEPKETPRESVESEEDKKEKAVEDLKSPKKENEEVKDSSKEPKTSRESSQEPKASRESSAEPEQGDDPIPDDVEFIDDLKKLNQLVDNTKYDVTSVFFEKISLFYGDITKIQVDAIVNAANAPLAGGGGVDGAIHRAAGERLLQAECKKHKRPVATGEAVMTTSCKLSTHVKNIIHCVGPVCYSGVTNERRKKLLSCYKRAIQLCEENGLRSIAFCCISTGIYGYDNQDAARTVIKFLWKHFSKPENAEKWDRVVLCLFMDIDKKYYKHYILKLMNDSTYFDDDAETSEDEDEEEDKKKKDKKENDGEEKKEKKEDGDENKEKKEDGDEKKEKDKHDEKDKKDVEMEENKPSKDSEAKEDETAVEKIEDTGSQTEKKTMEGVEAKKEEALTTASPSTTSTLEKTAVEEEEDGEKIEGEKENNEVDGKVKNEDDVINLKRAVSDEKEEQPPIKRDKKERESAV